MKFKKNFLKEIWKILKKTCMWSKKFGKILKKLKKKYSEKYKSGPSKF